MRRAVGDDTDLRLRLFFDARRRHQRARGLVLASQALHHPRIHFRALGIARRFVVTRAASEEDAFGVLHARQRAPGNPVAVHVAIALELGQLRQRLVVQHLAAIPARLGIGERIAHPIVHAQVEIRQHEHRRLQPLRQIEGRHAEFVAFGHRAREQHHVPRVAVRQCVRELHVALRGARRQAGARPNALDVPHHRRDLGVVAIAGELRHQ